MDGFYGGFGRFKAMLAILRVFEIKTVRFTHISWCFFSFAGCLLGHFSFRPACLRSLRGFLEEVKGMKIPGCGSNKGYLKRPALAKEEKHLKRAVYHVHFLIDFFDPGEENREVGSSPLRTVLDNAFAAKVRRSGLKTKRWSPLGRSVFFLRKVCFFLLFVCLLTWLWKKKQVLDFC